MKKISQASSVQEAIKIAKVMELVYPVRPKKPLSSTKFNSNDYRQYADKLEEYEKDKATYDLECKKFNAHKQTLNNELVEFIKDFSGLNNIPEQYRDKVYSYAYQQGHSNGHIEVYNILEELIEIF